MASGLWFALVTLAVGWLALAPAARRMGPLGYHVAAFPIGLLGWTGPALLAIVLQRGYSWPLVIGGLAAYIFVLYRACLFAVGREKRPSMQIPLPGFLAVGAVASIGVIVFSAWGPSVSTYDGWGQYELESWQLHDNGRAGIRILSARMIALPAAHAAYHFLGGEFASILYPMLSLSLASLVAAGVWWATAGAPRWARILVVFGVLAGLVSNAFYLFMSIYMHAHTMVTGFLVLALIAVERATVDVRPDGEGAGLSKTWLLIAGVAMAGFVLARPDSPAYVLVPLLTAIAIMLRLNIPRDAFDLIMAPLTACLPIYVAATFVQRGLWTSNKSTASMLLMFTAIYAVMWLALRIGMLDRFQNTRRFLGYALVVQTIAVLGLIDLLPDRFAEVMANQWVNMTQYGGWGSTWSFVAAFAVTSVVLRPRRGRNRFRIYVAFAIVEFIIVALLIHGLSHLGRVGWGDSLNRITFHVLPVFYLYLGMYLGELMRALKPATAMETT